MNTSRFYNPDFYCFMCSEHPEYPCDIEEHDSEEN